VPIAKAYDAKRQEGIPT